MREDITQPSDTNQEAAARDNGLSRRHILAVLAGGLTTAALNRGKNVTTGQVEEVLKNHILGKRELRVKQVVSEEIKQGGWLLTRKEEKPLSLPSATGSHDLDVAGILRDQEAMSLVTGDYYYSSPEGLPGRTQLHLGNHGSAATEAGTQLIPHPEQLAVVSFDSLPNVAAFARVEVSEELLRPPGLTVIESMPLEHFSPELLSAVQQRFNETHLQWVGNLETETVLFAPDIPANAEVMAAAQAQFSAVLDPQEVQQLISQTATSAERSGALVTFTAITAAIKHMFAGKMSRRAFLSKTVDAVGMGAVGYAAYKFPSLSPLYQQYKDTQSLIDFQLQNSQILFPVSERTPEQFVGRIEAILQADADTISFYDRFRLLRDLVSAYKERMISEARYYEQEGRQNSLYVWGAAHDTKVGLMTLPIHDLLNTIQRFAEHFHDSIALMVGQNTQQQEWWLNILPDTLWSASAYKTQDRGDGYREIKALDVWYFPELREILLPLLKQVQRE